MFSSPRCVLCLARRRNRRAVNRLRQRRTAFAAVSTHAAKRQVVANGRPQCKPAKDYNSAGGFTSAAGLTFLHRLPQTTARLRRYSITASARASRVGGISRPSAFAVVRLIASSYLVAVCIGS